MDASILEQIERIPLEEQQELLALAEKIQEAEEIKAARSSFLSFVKYMMPHFIEGRHLRIMAAEFDKIVSGENNRVIINMPPRHGKSLMTSVYLPAYYLGHYPDRYVIQASHNADLAKEFGREVRNMVATERYKRVFPNTELQADTKAAGLWHTTRGGRYFAVGSSGKIAGRGAHLFLMDDVDSEQDYIRSLGGDMSAFKDTHQWYQTGPRQRLQPNAAILNTQTRWAVMDMTGFLIKRMTSDPGADQWKIIEFPAIFPETDNILWPEFWKKEEMLRTKAELTPQQWAAQYLQQPTSEGAALVKREWWKTWKGDPPECEYIIQTWDTAFTKKAQADRSAKTDWGIFYCKDEETNALRPNIILLDALADRMEFPELKQTAYDEYKRVKPDSVIIEAKASGLPLIQELRMMGIPVSDFTPVRGTRAAPNDKITRVNAVSDIFKSGLVWRIETRATEEVVEEFAAFPSGEHDDLVDCGVMALMRFRQGGFISLYSDEDEDEFFPQRKADYY